MPGLGRRGLGLESRSQLFAGTSRLRRRMRERPWRSCGEPSRAPCGAGAGVEFLVPFVAQSVSLSKKFSVINGQRGAKDNRVRLCCQCFRRGSSGFSILVCSPCLGPIRSRDCPWLSAGWCHVPHQSLYVELSAFFPARDLRGFPALLLWTSSMPETAPVRSATSFRSQSAFPVMGSVYSRRR